jgi:hypothetical protein
VKVLYSHGCIQGFSDGVGGRHGGSSFVCDFVLHVGSSRTQASTNNSEQGLAGDIWQIVIGDLDH